MNKSICREPIYSVYIKPSYMLKLYSFNKKHINFMITVMDKYEIIL